MKLPGARLSEGARNFFFTTAAFAVIGAVFAVEITMRLLERPIVGGPIDGLTVWVVACGAVGGAIGFVSVCPRWFGHNGLRGWLCMLGGGLALTLTATVIGGTLILPYYGTMFAPFQFALAVISDPTLGWIWGAMIICAHKLMGVWREEQVQASASTVPKALARG